MTELESHVNWSLFDEDPNRYKGKIAEIGYAGACKYFFDNDENPRYMNRRKERMAEFFIKSYVALNELCCIVVKDKEKAEYCCRLLKKHQISIDVFIKPDCYF